MCMYVYWNRPFSARNIFQEIVHKCSFEYCPVIDISRYEYKSNRTHKKFTKDSGLLHHLELYVCVNMWWIDFYSSNLETHFCFVSFMFCFVSFDSNKIPTKNLETRGFKHTKTPENYRFQYVRNGFWLIYIAKVVSFHCNTLTKTHNRQWCHQRLYNRSMAIPRNGNRISHNIHKS